MTHLNNENTTDMLLAFNILLIVSFTLLSTYISLIVGRYKVKLMNGDTQLGKKWHFRIYLMLYIMSVLFLIYSVTIFTPMVLPIQEGVISTTFKSSKLLWIGYGVLVWVIMLSASYVYRYRKLSKSNKNKTTQS